jgi:hypothetical protein
VSNISAAADPGGIRSGPLPSAEIDSAGTVYVAWGDCRFRSGCPANDIVLSKSTSETTWGAVTRVTSGTGDNFIPGIGVDRSTSGSSARIGITYYNYPNPSCSASTCQLDVSFVSSVNGGSTWSVPAQLAGPMTLSWLASTNQGVMVGDYCSTSVLAGGNAFGVFAVASAPSGGTFNEAMFTPSGGSPITGGARRAVSGPVTAPAPVPRTAPPAAEPALTAR